MASFMVFRSFVSNGSFLWYTVRSRGDNSYTGINSLGYGYCGWLNEHVLLCPATTYNVAYNPLCATMDTHDATTDWSNDNASKLLDKQLDNGVITVCGLGFIPESIDFAARTFTVRDSKYGKPMTFRLNFRDNLTDAGRKPNQPLVSLIVNGDERWLLPHASTNTLKAVS